MGPAFLGGEVSGDLKEVNELGYNSKVKDTEPGDSICWDLDCAATSEMQSNWFKQERILFSLYIQFLYRYSGSGLAILRH